MTADGQLVALGHSDPDLNANGRDHQELFRWFFYSFCPPTSFLVVTFFHDVFFLKCSLCDSSYFPFLRGFRFSQAKHASKKVNEFLKRKPDLLMTCVIFARAEYDVYKSLGGKKV
ncbi:hypothetical protein OUZ56_001669 [Daphnia magna]|uniref:Uncharacterized protein n=1 Tax=Daphnia magna TaxID=35525 RepID=A0ABR0A3D0_9CRUS|nr:hypothetical protein OUZ56_001669 [Daphnia magna]